jgi:hypothetical protein
LFSSLYGGKGLLLGWLQFTNDTPGGTVSWFKSGGAARQQYYPAGFLVTTNLIGSIFEKPASKVLGLTNSFASLVLEGGDLSGSLTNTGVTLVKNRALFTTNACNLTLTANPASGTFTGSFLAPGTTRKTKFNGVFLQRQNIGVGWFLGSSHSGSITVE